MKRFSEYKKDLIGESSKVYKALSPKMKKAVDELFKSADKLDQMDTLIPKVAKKYGIKVSSIMAYLDKETLR
jgi:chromosomal replication initiation ATPase DnaA